MVDEHSASTANDTHRGVVSIKAATSIHRLAPVSKSDFSFAITTPGRVWKLDPREEKAFQAWTRAFAEVRGDLKVGGASASATR